MIPLITILVSIYVFFLLRHDPKIKKLNFYFDKKIGWLSLTTCHVLAFLG
jgi:hypothetical protein